MRQSFFLILFFSGFTIMVYSQTKSLDFYLNEGLRNSPLLNEYKNQIRSAEADSLLIRAGKKPQVEARSQLLYSPFYKNFGYDEVITDGGNYTAVMGVTQNIFNRREINNKYEGIAILKQSVSNTSKISAIELGKIITGQYLSAFSDFKDLSFNRSFLELFQAEDEIIKQFVKTGLVKQTDYLSHSVETQSQEILVSQLKSQYRTDLILLNELCGLNDTTWYVLTDPQLTIKGAPDITRNRSYIQFKIDSIKIENEKLAIDIRYKPKVNWFADAGFLTSNPWNFYQHFGYSAGIGLTIPVYDGKQREIEKQKLAFDENSRKAYEYNYRNKYFQQIRQLENELKSLNEMSLRMENQLMTSDQLVKALKTQLEAGNIQMTEYINAIKNFKSTSRNLNMVSIQKLQVVNEMNFLLAQ
jgi:outer membrane protein TolC